MRLNIFSLKNLICLLTIISVFFLDRISKIKIVQHHLLNENGRIYLNDYLNLIEPILLEPDNLYKIMKSKNNWNLERYIKFHLDRKGYFGKVKFIPYIMFSVRTSKIKTTFRPGTYSSKHKFYIKYFKEYLSSMIMYYLVGKKNKNYNNFKFLNFSYKIFKNLFKIRFLLNLFLRNKRVLKKFDKDFVKHNLENKIKF